MITPFPLNTLTIGEGYSLCTSEIASLALSHVVTKGLDQKRHPKFESLGQPFFDIGKKASLKQQESFGECMLVFFSRPCLGTFFIKKRLEKKSFTKGPVSGDGHRS